MSSRVGTAQGDVVMVKARLDDIRRQAIMMQEARAAFADMDAAHVFAEHLAMNPGARIEWESVSRIVPQPQKVNAATAIPQFPAILRRTVRRVTRPVPASEARRPTRTLQRDQESA